MFTKKMLLFPAAGAMMLCVAACQTAEDVPVPDDPRAKEWSTQIKGSYPGWQSTEKMPEGNAEYDALFTQPEAPVVPEQKAAEKPEPVVKTDDGTGADLTGGELKQEVKEAKAEVPEQKVAPKGPSSAMIGIKADGSLQMNGSALTQDALKTALSTLAAEHGENSLVVIRTLGNVPPAAVNSVLDLCRDLKIGKVRFVRHGAVAPDVKKNVKATKAVQMRLVVDTEKPASDYTVQKGDTLSGISLKFYKNAGYWKTIVKANPKLKDANRLIPGTKLKVPVLKRVPVGK